MSRVFIHIESYDSRTGQEVLEDAIKAASAVNALVRRDVHVYNEWMLAVRGSEVPGGIDLWFSVNSFGAATPSNIADAIREKGMRVKTAGWARSVGKGTIEELMAYVYRANGVDD